MHISALCSGKHDHIWLHAFSHYLNSMGSSKLVLFDYVIVNKNTIFMFTVVIKHKEIEKHVYTGQRNIYVCKLKDLTLIFKYLCLNSAL